MNIDPLSLGRDHHGIFTRAEALDCGETDRSLARALRAGVLVRLRRGSYVSAETYAACEDEGKHLLHAWAALAAQEGEVALDGASAGTLQGQAIYQQDLSVVHLLRLDGGSGRHSASAAHHHLRPDLRPTEIVEIDGVRAVSPARAVWEVASRSSLEAGVVAADSALRLDPAIMEALEELQERFARVPGSRTAREAVRLADPRSESAGESVTRVQFYRYRLPMPELQHEVFTAYGRLVGRTDFCWPECRHLGEFDGKVKYERYLKKGESASDRVVREKEREDDLRGENLGMTRFVWSDVMPSAARRTMAALVPALARSQRLYVDLGATG